MNMKTALVLAAAVIAATPAYAIDSYTITQTVPDTSLSVVDRPVDIIGLKAGMSAPEALAILGKEYGGEDKVDRFNMKLGTQQVQSQQFDVFYQTDGAGAYLTSPIAGNKVFAASRTLGFKIADGLPSVADIKAQLVEKYGVPTKEYKSSVSDLKRSFWYLGGKGECNGTDICEWPYTGGPSGGSGGVLGSYDVAKYQEYEKALSFGTDVIIVAETRTAYGYPDGVQYLTVSFVDLSLRAASAKADYELIMKKQAEFDGKKVAVPKL